MFGIELAGPLLIFFGRRSRQIACGAFVLLMLLICLTGNYCFFNWLTVTLCVLLRDDPFLLRLATASVAAFLRRRLIPPARPDQESRRPRGNAPGSLGAGRPPIDPPPAPPEEGSEPSTAPVHAPYRDGSGKGFWIVVRTVSVGALAAILLLVSGAETVARLFRRQSLPRPLLALLQLVSPLRTINSYG